MNHNNTGEYSKKLLRQTIDVTQAIRENPGLGKPTGNVKIRTKLVGEHFLLIYRINITHISILRFWDTRRNPAAIKRYY